MAARLERGGGGAAARDWKRKGGVAARERKARARGKEGSAKQGFLVLIPY